MASMSLFVMMEAEAGALYKKKFMATLVIIETGMLLGGKAELKVA
jgi:hypothetical protein